MAYRNWNAARRTKSDLTRLIIHVCCSILIDAYRSIATSIKNVAQIPANEKETLIGILRNTEKPTSSNKCKTDDKPYRYKA